MIYLDFNATTPMDSRVRDQLLRSSDLAYANPASLQHAAGRAAQTVVEDARVQAADALGVAPKEVIWTSGASESISLAVMGLVASQIPSRRTVLVSPTEHKAVLAAADLAERVLGARVIYLHVDSAGVVECGSLESQLDESVCLVAAMHSNNETGVLNPIDEIASLCRANNVPVLVDATQSLGKVDLGPACRGADLMALSAHKAYGPKGVGVLLARGPMKRQLVSFQPGGGQEFGMRGGTHNSPGISASALAIELAMAEQVGWERHSRALVERLHTNLQSKLTEIDVVTGSQPRLGNTINIRFHGADAEAVMANAPNVAVATGSACNAANPEPSHVLLAMGLTRAQAEESIRFSVGKETSESEIDEATDAIVQAVTRVRRLTAA